MSDTSNSTATTPIMEKLSLGPAAPTVDTTPIAPATVAATADIPAHNADEVNHQADIPVCIGDKESVESEAAPMTVNRNRGEALVALIEERDRLIEEYSGPYLDQVIAGDTETNNGDIILNRIEKLNKAITVFKQTLKIGSSSVITVKANATGSGSSVSSDAGLKLSTRDVPKMQLKGTVNKPFPSEPAYDTVEHFLRAFEKTVMSTGKTIDSVWRYYVPVALGDEHHDWLKDVLLKCNTWGQAKKQFEKRFHNTHTRLLAKREVMTMKMRLNETANEYAARFGRAAGEAGYSKLDKTLSDTFMYGFPENWQVQISAVLLSLYGDKQEWLVDEVTNAANHVYGDKKPGELSAASSSGFNNYAKETNANNKRSSIYMGKQKRKDDAAATMPTLFKRLKYNDTGSIKPAAKLEAPSKRFFGSSKNVPRKAFGNKPCRFCNKDWFRGHTCDEYRNYKAGNPVVLSIRKTSNNSNEAKCFKRAMEDEQYECKYDVPPVNDDGFNLITPIIIGNKKLVGLCDPGSDISCINKYIINKEFNNIDICNTTGYLNFLTMNDNKDGSNKTKRIGQTEPMSVRYRDDLRFKHAFEVVEFNDVMSTSFDVLLGRDILSKMGVYLANVAYKWPKEESNKEDLQFENVNYDDKNEINPEDADYGNPDERSTYMDAIKNALTCNTNIKSNAVCTMKESQVNIKLKSDANCYVRQYPLTTKAHAEIEKQLQGWLKDGIVAEAKPSPYYHSPLLVVPKKDENNKATKLRVCCDLRKINAALTDDNQHNFAVPKIQDIFNSVASRGKIISKIDLRQAYFSFEVAESSRKYLNFSFNHKNYEWNHAAFGLKFLTSQFCYCMRVLLGDIPDVETYVDDCVIFSETIESHIKTINEVITRLTFVNLRINTEKCTWFKTSVYLLGFVVGQGVTKIDMRRLSNINEWKIPKTAKQVRSIMGVVSHLRDYCPMLSKIAAPIDSLRNSKSVEKEWTQLHTDHFESIKQILLSNAILHTPDLSRTLYLCCDASVYGLGCALIQKDELGRTVHIAFISKSLNDTERRWSTNRRETAAIIFGLERFRPLLWGHPDVVIMTDHLSLTFLFTSSTLNSTLQTYFEILGEFNFTVAYIKGIQNILPDKLSRVYPPIDEDKTLEGEQDRHIRRLEKLILTRRATSDVKKDTKQIVRRKAIHSKDKNLNILAIKLNSNEFKSQTTDYTCPPVNERISIIKDAHSLGHFGIDSVVKHIHSNYGLHWNTIYKDCKEVLMQCKECAQHNIAKRGFNPQKSIVAYDVFDHVSFDLLGPLPVTDKGNIYILVLVDLCTKYIIARAIPNKQSNTVVQTLVNIYGDYGAPISIQQSDNGREFRNSLMKVLTDALPIQHRFSTPYYPQSNGAAENSVCCIPPTILHRHNSKESTVHLCHTRTLSDNPIRLTRPA
jgi:hypothetical protein